MKKIFKIILAAAMSLVMLFSMATFAACGESNDDQTDTGRQDTLDLADVSWSYKESTKYDVQYYVTRSVQYCANPVSPSYQAMNIYVPAEYMEADGSLVAGGKRGSYTTETAPILFVNTVGGYAGNLAYEITASTADGSYLPYLAEGCVVVFTGERGRNTEGSDGSTGQAPLGLVDLKAGIRYLRHNANKLAGNTDRIISIGTSAGGAMSSLLGTTANSPDFDVYLEDMGAFMDETDDVYAVQAYCPVTDLEHADMAYEWMFNLDYSETNTTESQPNANTGSTEFDYALSSVLASGYVEYINGLGLEENGAALTLDEGGRSGSLYDWLIDKLEDSADIYLTGLGSDAASYISDTSNKVSEWLSWDGSNAVMDGSDTYSSEIDAMIYSAYRTRYKSVAAFDSLDCDTSENNEFGSGSVNNFRHFSQSTTEAIASLKDEYPEEYAAYYEAYASDAYNEEVEDLVYKLNPLNYINDKNSDNSEHFRIRLGTQDADTSFLVSATLALELEMAGLDVDYGFVWDEPHTNADREGEFMDWVDSIM